MMSGVMSTLIQKVISTTEGRKEENKDVHFQRVLDR